MPATTTLASTSPASPVAEAARILIVAGCALALILAGPVLPF